MTHAQELIHLHQRLVLDTSTAFTGTYPGPITPTPAGRRWLKDLNRYKRLFVELLHSESNPSAMLREHFGFIDDSDNDPDDALKS